MATTPETPSHAAAQRIATEILGMPEAEYAAGNFGVNVDCNGDVILTLGAAQGLIARMTSGHLHPRVRMLSNILSADDIDTLQSAVNEAANVRAVIDGEDHVWTVAYRKVAVKVDQAVNA